MRIIKYALLVAIATFLILASGCSGNQNGLAQTFIGGIEGLNMNFLTDSPPAVVYDAGANDAFDIVVQVQNKGEHTVKKDDGFVRISGLSAADYSKSEGDLTKGFPDDLRGLALDPEGKIIDTTPIFVEFQNFKYKRENAGNLQQAIQADACYKYGTKVATNLCIKKDLLKQSSNSVCTVSGSRSVSNSGAPVAVTAVEETPYGKDKIAFTLTITHQGNGFLFKHLSSTNDRCRVGSFSNENKVFVKVNTNMPGTLTCSPFTDSTSGSSLGGGQSQGFVRLSNGMASVRCTQTVSANTDFEQIVDIELEYDYMNTASASTIIKHTVSDK